jgi:hypothetical protein
MVEEILDNPGMSEVGNMATNFTGLRINDVDQSNFTGLRANDAERSLYIAAMGGALLLATADFVNNQETSVVMKTGDLMLRDFGYRTPLIMFLITAIGGFLCWIYRPRNRVDAFVRGASVLTILTLATPYKQAPLSASIRDLPERVTFSEFMIYTDRTVSQISQDAVLVRIRTSDGDIQRFDALVTLRDESGSIVAREQVRAAEFRLAQPAGLYALEIEASGYRRTRSDIEIPGRIRPRVYEIIIDRSDIPLTVQRLYPPADVPAVPITEAPEPQAVMLSTNAAG